MEKLTCCECDKVIDRSRGFSFAPNADDPMGCVHTCYDCCSDEKKAGIDDDIACLKQDGLIDGSPARDAVSDVLLSGRVSE